MKLRVLQRVLFILVAGVLLSLTGYGQAKNFKLADQDKSEIVKSVLNQFFENYPDELETDEIILSSLNINTFPISLQSNANLNVLTPDEINSRIRREGFADYLVFTKIKVKGSRVFVTLESLHSVEHNSEIIPTYGHGFVWKNTKKSGRWIAECINTSAFTTTLDLGTGQ